MTTPRKLLITTVIFLLTGFSLAVWDYTATVNSPSAQIVASATFTAHGTLTLHGHKTGQVLPTFITMGGVSVGANGYDDIRGGNSVTFYGADGSVVAATVLNPGKYVAATGDAQFTYSAPVPYSKGPMFQYEISHRSRLPFNANQGLTNNLDSELNR